MRVLVLGAGVIGVTTAYYLHAAGHEVAVIERRAGPGLETSFANAGDVCPSYATPWAAPGMRSRALKWLFEKDAPATLHVRLDPALWKWIGMWLANCNAERFAQNKARMQRIARYSLECLQALRARESIHYDETCGGWMQVFRTQAGLDHAQISMRILRDAGINHRLVDGRGAIEIDPGLTDSQVPIAGGLHFPDDETGDCLKFTQSLAALLASRGVVFHYNTRITAIDASSAAIDKVRTEQASFDADVYVIALAAAAVPLLRPLGIYLPIQPVKGYSITLPIRNAARAPRTAIVDEALKVAITRMGDRLRAAGTAELGARAVDAPAARCHSLLRAVRELYPNAADSSAPQAWAGMRPMTPDGPPILGPSPLANLFFNLGHGSNGWTQACGAGRVLADLVSGKDPAIDLQGLTLARYLQTSGV